MHKTKRLPPPLFPLHQNHLAEATQGKEQEKPYCLSNHPWSFAIMERNQRLLAYPMIPNQPNYNRNFFPRRWPLPVPINWSTSVPAGLQPCANLPPLEQAICTSNRRLAVVPGAFPQPLGLPDYLG